MTSAPALREFVRTHAEDRPGVYRFYGPSRELIYVGKSIRVRTRLLSYFSAPRRSKASRIAATAVDASWSYVPNEFEAVVTEMRLIQRHRPRYNVEHKRRRRYGFVKVTREPAPRVLPVTRVVEDGATYFGPFPRTHHVLRATRDLVHTLGLRDCPGPAPVFFDDQLEVFGRAARSPLCLRADVGSCLAPCCGRTDAKAYADRARMAVTFLGGRGGATLELVERRMREAAERLDFEYAALLRKRRERLARFLESLAAFRGRLERLTFVYRVPGFRGDDRLYLVKGGRVRATLTHPKSRDARSEAVRLAEEVFNEPERGVGGLTPEGAAEVLLVARWFETRARERRRTFGAEEWIDSGRDPRDDA